MWHKNEKTSLKKWQRKKLKWKKKIKGNCFLNKLRKKWRFFFIKMAVNELGKEKN